MRKSILALSLLCAITFSTVQPQAAAKTKAPVFSKSIYSVYTGDSKTLPVKNLPKDSKCQWKIGKTSVATITQKGKVTAKKAGKTNVKCTITVGKKKYTIKTILNVKWAKTESVIVHTQSQLDLALQNPNVKSIKLSTSIARDIKIAAGKYKDKVLHIVAPNTNVINNAEFKRVGISKIRPESWTENAKGNDIVVNAEILTFKISKTAEVKSLNFKGSKLNAKIVNQGTVNSMNFNTDADIFIQNVGTMGAISVSAGSIFQFSGSSKKSISVNVKNGKTVCPTIVSAIPLQLAVEGSAQFGALSGSGGSTVNLLAQGSSVVVRNVSKDVISIQCGDERDSVTSGTEKTFNR